MSTPQQLRAEASAADRKADAIFARIDAASAAAKPDAFGGQPLVPPGHEADAARASELRLDARVLREEAADMEAERARAAAKPKSADAIDSKSAPPPPASNAARAPAGAGAGQPLDPAALAAERARMVAIINEAGKLGIGQVAVDAAIASDMTSDQFVERFAPEEAAARRIAAA